jgi:hypothetical protein
MDRKMVLNKAKQIHGTKSTVISTPQKKYAKTNTTEVVPVLAT